MVIAGLHAEQTKFSLQSETVCKVFLFIRCPTWPRCRLCNTSCSADPFPPLLWDTMACLIPQECTFFVCIICIVSKHRNTAFVPGLSLHWCSMIEKLDLLKSKQCIYMKTKNCNGSTVWAASRWQQSFMHLRSLKKMTCTVETHIYCILWHHGIVLDLFLFCCLFWDVLYKYISFTNMLSLNCSNAQYLCKFLCILIIFLSLFYFMFE